MSSLFAQYKQERENKHVLEVENGFATYYFPQAGTCYLEDIFVAPAARKSRLCFSMADEIVAIAKKAGCVKLLGSVCAGTHNSTVSLKVLLAYGFQLHGVEGQMIYFVKEI